MAAAAIVGGSMFVANAFEGAALPQAGGRPALVRGWSWRLGQRPVACVAVLGLGTALASSLWLVLAAAQRPSVLSPPTLRGSHHWLLGPLSGALPGLTHDPRRLHADLTIALCAMFVAWLAGWACSHALPGRVVAVAVGAANAVWVLGPPQPLTDVFNYVTYGRMAARGINPYTTAPVAAPHDAAWTLANWHHLPSPYGPLFTLVFEPLAPLPAEAALWVWKIVLVAGTLGLLAVVWRLAERLDVSPQRAIACVGLCPLTLAFGVGGFHNDTPAVLCVVGAAALVLRRQPRSDLIAGSLVVAAAGLKPSFVVAVPLIMLGASSRRSALAGVSGSAVLCGLVLVLGFGGHLPAIAQQSRLVTPLSIPNLVGWALGHGGADAGVRTAGRSVLLLATAVAAGLVAQRRERMLASLGVILLLAALTLSWVMPWYIGWCLPFAALGRPRALVPLTVVAALWLGVGGVPQMPKLIHAVGFYPTTSATGMANHLYEQSLVR